MPIQIKIDELFYFISILAIIAAYFLRLERRLTRIETKLETVFKILNSRSKPQNPTL